jgi:hypothetical protein
VHLDWHTSIHDGKKVYVCVVLDDSSRRILAGGEFDGGQQITPYSSSEKLWINLAA